MYRKNKTISFGDKIFARVTLNGRTVYNFVSEKIANMSQLLNELRFAMKDIHGLVMIHIRNYNRGWGDERPLMLYPEKINRNYNPVEMTQQRGSEGAERRMLFPWETH